MNAPAPIAEYRTRFDRVYYREARSRIRPTRHALRWFGIAFLAIVVALFVLFSAIAIADGDWGTVAITTVPFVGFFVYLRKRAPPDLALLRNGVAYGAETRILVSGSGVELFGTDTATSLRWAAFLRAIVDEGGVLLIDADGTAVWLPDRALQAGERAAVEALIRGALPEAAKSR